MTPEHGSAEWEAERLGKLTASRLHDAIGTTQKGLWLASRRKYMIELVGERLTGKRAGGIDDATYLPRPMQWGVETEPQAMRAYEAGRGVKLEPLGFVNHPLLGMSGATPDAGVGADGLLEVKCPESATHVATLVEREIPEKYLLQMHWQMACCPMRQWVDYMSFDPRMPPKFRAAVIRVPRDQKKLAHLTLAAQDFLDEVAAIVAGLESGAPYVPADWKPKAVNLVPLAKPEHVGSEDITRDLKPTPLVRPR